jgi:uncharacterized protein YecE (DUF72 family)
MAAGFAVAEAHRDRFPADGEFYRTAETFPVVLAHRNLLPARGRCIVSPAGRAGKPTATGIEFPDGYTRRMTLWVGTSGYNYPEWKGSFYPEKIPVKKMLPYYAARFSTVEINYTYYRMPTEQILAGWNGEVPDPFRFTLKAPRRITHNARLRDCADLVGDFLDLAATLGPKLGAILFQLPPNLRRDLPLLDAFLATLPRGTCAAFEFRHSSWLEDAVYDRLRARNLALCVADSEEASTPIVITADYGYFRLRDEGYKPADTARWARMIREQSSSCRDLYVYFKHEKKGNGPRFARRFVRAFGG